MKNLYTKQGAVPKSTLEWTTQRERFTQLVEQAQAINWQVQVPVPWRDDAWWTPSSVVADYAGAFRLVGPGHEPREYPWTEAGVKDTFAHIRVHKRAVSKGKDTTTDGSCPVCAVLYPKPKLPKKKTPTRVVEYSYSPGIWGKTRK